MAERGRTPAERALIEEVSAQRLWEDTQRIGARYRESGSEAEREAVQYIVQELNEVGIEDVDIYELNAYLSYHREAECEVVFPERRRIPAVARAYTASTPVEGVEVELVLADTYDGAVPDKAVLTARDWAGGEKARHARVQIHAQTTNEPNLHRGGGTPVWGVPSLRYAHLLETEPTGIMVSRPDAEYLRTLVQRGPVRVWVRTVVETGWRRITFPVATIRGREPTFVLVGGHLDSHDPGVTDNATGCASLLEIARVFSKRRADLRHGLKIGWWTGHESAGYAGSTWFCDHAWDALHDHGVFFLTIDGPGIRGATVIEARYVFPQAERFIVGLVREYFGRDPDLIAKPIKMGDQSFWGTGIPSGTVYRCLAPDHPDWAVVFGAGHGRWWHSTEDTLDKVDFEILLDDTRFYALALFRLCTAQSLPFEFVTYARWMRATLEDLQRDIGERFDLHRLLMQTDEFAQLATLLLQADAAVEDADRRLRIERCKMQLSRILNPVYFTLEGPYHHDLRAAVPGPPVRYQMPGEAPFEPRYFPGLQQARRLKTLAPDSGEYAVLYSTVLRERNRVSHALSGAIVALRECVSTL